MLTKPEKVVVHPTVLLSVVDHFKRLSDKRVVGILLGSMQGQTLDVSNSFAGKSVIIQFLFIYL